MSYKGKEFTPEMIQLVVNLKKYFDAEKHAGGMTPTKNAVKRTANGLGIGEATVKRIMASYNKNDRKVVIKSPKPRGKRTYTVSVNLQPIIRQFIRHKNLKGRRASIEKLHNYLLEQFQAEIPITTLWRYLKRLGFIYGVSARGSTLKERDDIILARRQYLRAIRANHNSDATLKRPEVYVGETYINTKHSSRFTWYLGKDGPWINEPQVKGSQLVIIHAVTTNGWVNGAKLVFQPNKQTGYFNGLMDWENLSRWFINQLLPNIPLKAIIIIDSTPCYNVLTGNAFPTTKTRKREMREWLSKNNYPWTKDMLKTELLALCKRLAPAPEYGLDRLVEALEHRILRIPQYHPELQPIETCWAMVKKSLDERHDFTIDNLEKIVLDDFSGVNESSCKKLIYKVAKQSEKYWREDYQLDKIKIADEEIESFEESAQLGEGYDEYNGFD